MAKIEELHDTGKRLLDLRRCQAFRLEELKHCQAFRLEELKHCQAFRLEELKRRLATREGVTGMEKNCEALRREIARLEGSTNGNP